MGHRDNPAHPGATGCPGDYLYPAVADIGRRAVELLRMAEGKPTTPPKPAETVLLARVVKGDGWWSIARRCYGTATAELAWLRPRTAAWTVWTKAAPEQPARLVGILARSSQGWSWSLGVACPAAFEMHPDRESAFQAMQRSVTAATDFLTP